MGRFYICLHSWLMFMGFYVGIYTIPMDGKGNKLKIKCILWIMKRIYMSCIYILLFNWFIFHPMIFFKCTVLSGTKFLYQGLFVPDRHQWNSDPQHWAAKNVWTDFCPPPQAARGEQIHHQRVQVVHGIHLTQHLDLTGFDIFIATCWR